MNRTCDREQAVLDMMASGREDKALTAHLAQCPICQEVAEVTRFMRALANESALDSRPLPEPAHLWWKAKILQRWDAERQAARPLDAMQHFELAAGVIGLLVLAIWQWPTLARWMTNTEAGSVSALLAPTAYSGLFIILTIGVVFLGLSTAAIFYGLSERD